MSNQYYNRQTECNPGELADGLAIEAEFDSLGRAFDKLPDPHRDGGGFEGPVKVGSAVSDEDAVQKAQLTEALGGFLSKSGNLADLADKATSRRNLGISEFSDTLLDDANAVAMRSTLGAAGVAATNSWSAEQKFSGDGTYADPDNGVSRAVKIGAKGLAVLGGIKSDTLTVAARPSWAGFTPLDSNNFPVEAGTFTPIIEGVVAGACTYSHQIGRYRRVGNLVTIWARVAWTGHTGTGPMDLKGLPFIPNATTNHIQIAQVTASVSMSIFQGGAPIGHIYPTGGAKIRIGKFDTATGVRGDVNVAAVGELWVTVTYEI